MNLQTAGANKYIRCQTTHVWPHYSINYCRSTRHGGGISMVEPYSNSGYTAILTATAAWDLTQ